MKKFFYFGEKLKEYEVRVLNERELRAGAGILFLFAIISFLTAWLTGNFEPTKVFVVVFLFDFFIRLFINPKYAPSLILGRIMVQKQTVEYVGAPQKRFAWSIGFVLAATMFYLVVVNSVIGPINLLVCVTCLTLLFFEAAFGICIGCKIYNIFHKEKAQLCPGNVCEPHQKKSIQQISLGHVIILTLSIIAIPAIASIVTINGASDSTSINTETNEQSLNEEECDVPGWAVDIGHKEQYILHNGCN